MTTIIRDTDYPKRRISARATIAEPLPRSFTLGDMIRVTSDRLSRQVASKIIEEESFFKTETDTELLDRLWNEYWLHTLSSSPLLSNQDTIC